MKKIFEDIKNKYNHVYLFKRDIQGNVIYWMASYAIHITGICFYHGRIHSQFLSDEYKSLRLIDFGMNIGKSNETTPLEQAYKELESEYKDHIKKGYKDYRPNEMTLNLDNCEFLNLVVANTNTDALGFAKPMKCQKFELGKVKYPCIGQPKYNGVRATISINYFKKDMFDDTPILILSKEGVEYKLNHLNIQLYNILKYLEQQGINNPVLDGEIYLPNTPVTTIGGAARNEANPINKQLQYVIFDLSIENISQKDRIYYLDNIEVYCLYHWNTYIENKVYLSPNQKLNSDEESLEYLDKCLKQGYEGAVTRQYEPEYAFGQRPMFMRKLKKFSDAEFEVIDIIEYGDRHQKVGYGCKFILKNDIADNTFECIPMGTSNERLQYYLNKDKFIGNKVTAKFYERTPDKKPFHANVIGLRNYEK